MNSNELPQIEKRIIYIEELQYECYFLGNGWKLTRQNRIKYVYKDFFYGYPFYIVFENINVVSGQLRAITNKDGLELLNIFPVDLILKDIIKHQQDYWLNLCIDFIVEMNCLNENVVKSLAETKNNKNFSQKLRHKIINVILNNNY